MDPYRPLRAVLFFYELLRCAALVSLPVSLLLPLEGGLFPYPALAAPQTLFLLMSLFVWLRPGAYRAYIPLYGAGKFITAVAFGAWYIFFLRSQGAAVRLLEPGQFGALGRVCLFSLGDIPACAAALVLMGRINRMNRAAAVPAATPAEGGG